MEHSAHAVSRQKKTLFFCQKKKMGSVQNSVSRLGCVDTQKRVEIILIYYIRTSASLVVVFCYLPFFCINKKKG